MRLSPHFTLAEMEASDTARRLGICNKAPSGVVKNLGYLASNLLEQIRTLVGKPIYISSGYRCERLNKAVGGSATSQHRYGQAVDIQVFGLSPKSLYAIIKNSNLQYDQLILEKTKQAEWVHVSFCKHNRNQNLIYINGKYSLD